MIAKILIAAVLALLLSGFQYLYKQKSHGLFVLRFFVYFLLFTLISNIHYTKKKEEINKPDLYILVDQSQSIKLSHSDSILKSILDSLSESELKNKFTVHYYGFGKDIYELDSLRFKEKETDISNAIQQLSFLYSHKNKTPLILLTDGISTSGRKNIPDDLLFDIYPVILGDTTHYENLYIDEVNFNPVAFQGNKFPVEILAGYEGKGQPHSKVQILHNNKKIAEKNITFHQSGIKKLNFLLPADQKGKQNYQVLLSPINREKNKKDNRKHFTIDIIDQKKKILFLSSFIHPDIGLIKRQLNHDKYIETEFSLIRNAPASLRSYSAIILYQPDASFEKAFPGKKLQKLNWFIITGAHTDWNWLNRKSLFFKKEVSRSVEEYFPYPNTDFELFGLPSLSFEKYPPLIDFYGPVLHTNASVALYSKIKNIHTKQPLLLFNKEEKQAALLGEGYWQWGMYANRLGETGNLNQLVQQIIQYISLNVDLNPIRAEYKTHYYQGEPVLIRVKILNENLYPDRKAQPVIKIFDSEKKKLIEAPFSLSGDIYSVELQKLKSGTYNFEIAEKKSAKKTYGKFQIMKLNKEEIDLRTDKEFLDQWAMKTNGKSYFPGHIHDLIQQLSSKAKYPALVRYSQKQSPLIDFRFLLFLIVLFLVIEWLIKKWRGKI